MARREHSWLAGAGLTAGLTAGLLAGCGMNPLDRETEVAGVVLNAVPTPTPVAVPASVNPFDPESVRAWQEILTGLGHPVAVDGVFGDQTLQATASLQRALGLDATGVVDAATLFATSLRWPPSADPEPTAVPEPTATAVVRSEVASPASSDITLGCTSPMSAALPHRSEFVVEVADPDAAVEFGIDYGDASQYVTADWNDAQLNGYVHRYTREGRFEVHAWVRWGDGSTSTAGCVLEIRQGGGSSPPRATTPPDLAGSSADGGDELPTGPPGG